MPPMIEIEALTKQFRRPARPASRAPWRRIKGFFAREWELVTAVDGISFTVEPGEAVAFLGPNGAGKTTTVKMLTGILTPTSGRIQVAGYVPHRQHYEYTYHIGLVMGQKSMLLWDIPVIESLRLYKDVYELDEQAFQERLAELARVLEIEDLLHVPVRKLSLGQRMRAEIASSLLHRPQVIFLDEPTIGLDLLSRRRMLEFIKAVNREGVTIFLTTHNIQEVVQVCRRVILIDKGRLIYDGSIRALEDLCEYQVVEFTPKETPDVDALRQATLGLPWEKLDGDNRYAVKAGRAQVGELAQRLSQRLPIDTIGIRPPDLEEVLGEIYEGKIRL